MPTVKYDVWIDRESSIQLDEGKTAKDLQDILAAQGCQTYDGSVEVWCEDGIRIGRLELYKLKEGETVSFAVFTESDAAERLQRKNAAIEAARDAETKRVHDEALRKQRTKEEPCGSCCCGKTHKVKTPPRKKTTYKFDGMTVEEIDHGFIIHF